MPEPSDPDFGARTLTPAESLVFVVDDDVAVLGVMQRLLETEGYPVRAFEGAPAALAAMTEEGESPTILLTDKNMPEMSGLELAEQALGWDPDIQVIVITGGGDEASAQTALKLGAADYLVKPFELEELAASVQRAVRRRSERQYRRSSQMWYREELERRTKELERFGLATLEVLVNALETRNEYFVGHSDRVAEVAVEVSSRLGLPDEDVEAIRIGALLHDVGMIAVPDRIVEKPGDLTDEEYRTLQLHCQRGADILAPLERFTEPARFVAEHHERWDGLGYPLGLEADAISLGGQVVGIAEAWTGLTEKRPHRQARPPREALEILRHEQGSWFRRDLVDALAESMRL